LFPLEQAGQSKRKECRLWLRVALSLTAAMLVVYFGFILLIAFAKDFLAERVVSGLSVGMALGVFVILATWVLTWIYVRWANRVYEPEVARLRGVAP
jgi:uncharacterized membrane protein (DUF485 family)